MAQRVDVVIVGGGVMGTAAAWQLARRGVDCVLLERFRIGHGRGSSHGPTRIFRLAYHHPDYVRMARRALAEWRALEELAGEPLLDPTGGLETGPGARESAEALEAAREPYEWLPPKAVEERWTALRVPTDDPVLFQGDAGVCRAERTVQAQARVAKELGATVLEEAPASALVPRSGDVEIRTGNGTLQASVAVVTAGPWAGPLLGAADLSLPLTITQEQVAYLEEGTGSALPSLIDRSLPPDPPTYAVPDPVHPGTVKVAEHFAGAVVTADDRTFEVDPLREDRALAWGRRWLREPGAVRDRETCLYTNTPDEDFVIDRVGPFVVGAACSGHGFKFGPLIGRVLADLVTGTETAVPVGRFSASRFGAALVS